MGYEIRAFDCMPMRFFFWERDEEFEAQGNILFDYSATDFNHVEECGIHSRFRDQKACGAWPGFRSGGNLFRCADNRNIIKPI